MARKIFYAFLIFSLFFPAIRAQELKCNVQVVSQKVQGTNKQVFENMQTAIYEFMNTRKWTQHVYQNEERIECNILINIRKRISSEEFDATIQVQSRRPVFGTSYSTTMLNLSDEKFIFTYVEFDPLEFSENTFTSNLTSVLAYYAYIILGFDYDSFSLEGGTPYFQLAEKIVNNAQNAREPGWKSYEGNQDNRYWFIENIMNNKYSPLREFMYNYHRLGLDRMHEEVAKGRATIAESLLLLREVYREKPALKMPYFDQVMDAKSGELVKIFSESFPDEKARVVNILNEIDPANSDKYQRIIGQK
jgi:hypothetical protein